MCALSPSYHSVNCSSYVTFHYKSAYSLLPYLNMFPPGILQILPFFYAPNLLRFVTRGDGNAAVDIRKIHFTP